MPRATRATCNARSRSDATRARAGTRPQAFLRGSVLEVARHLDRLRDEGLLDALGRDRRDPAGDPLAAVLLRQLVGAVRGVLDALAVAQPLVPELGEAGQLLRGAELRAEMEMLGRGQRQLHDRTGPDTARFGLGLRLWLWRRDRGRRDRPVADRRGLVGLGLRVAMGELVLGVGLDGHPDRLAAVLLGQLVLGVGPVDDRRAMRPVGIAALPLAG